MLFLLQTFKYCATTDRQPIRVEPYVDINQLIIPLITFGPV